MPVAVPELTWLSMTQAVNEIKPVSNFLTNLLFGDTEQLTTETLEYGVISADRSMAPFVEKNGRSIMVGGVDETFYTIEPPNISLSRPMEATSKFFTRRVGTPVFPTAATQASGIQQAIARDLERMSALTDNRLEWLVAQAIQGTISYEAEDAAAFTIAFPRDAGNTVTLAGTDLWDNAASRPEEHFLDAKQAINDAVGLNPTHAIMSRTAYDAFRKNAGVKEKLDMRRAEFGNLQVGAIDNGAVFGGMYEGIQIWMYNRSLVDVDGSSVDLIRDKYVEFVTADPAAENRIYYSAIADWDAYQDGAIAVQRFSKSWLEKDPSAMMSVLKSRPLPVPRRPNSFYSLKVLA